MMRNLNRIALFVLVGLLVAAGIIAATHLPALAMVSAAAAPQPVSAAPVAAPLAAPVAAGQHGLEVLGSFIAPNQAALMFKGSGRIAEIRVKEGASVKKGDVLAVLDSTELQLAVQQAQAALAGAQARLDQAKTPATDADTAAAQGALDAAMKQYKKVQGGPTPNDIAGLKAQVDNAKAAVDVAQAAYDKAGGATNPYMGMMPQGLQLQTATNNYNAALAAYNNASTHPTAAELAAAWGQVQQAQAALARLQPTSANMSVAQAAVDQAQAALTLAQQQVTNATLTAPFDGTVISVMPHVGEMAGPTAPVVTLADLAHLQLQAALDQSALARVQIGQSATIVADAFKNKTLTGKVSKIGWTATSLGGVTSVPITIDIDPNDVPLRPGLTASGEIATSNSSPASQQ